MTRPLPRVLFTAAIALGVVLLAWQACAVATISHDDGISLMAATGHQARYTAHMPSNHTVEAAEWQSFWTPGRFGVFRTIARDLATWDLHPPLYFWLLHVWLHIHGAGLDAGPLMNIPFHLVVALAIFLAARLLACPPWAAAVAGAGWLLAAPNLLFAAETRQYSLLAALAACFLVALIHFVRRPAPAAAAGVLLIGAAGLLTHYHFALLLIALGGVAGALLLREQARRASIMLGAALGGAALLFAAVHPAFHLSLLRQSELKRYGAFAWTEAPSRIGVFVRSLAEFLLPREALAELAERPWIAALALAAGLAGSIVLARKWRPKLSLAALPLLGGAIVAGAIGALHASFMSPGHAMGAKYLVLASPLLFVALAQGFTHWAAARPRLAVTIACLLVASQAGFGIASTARFAAGQRDMSASTPAGGEQWIVDSVQRGVLPRVLLHAAPATPVLAARQVSLPALLRNAPLEGVILYVSDSGYGNTPAGRQAVLDALARRGYGIAHARGAMFGVGEVFEIRAQSAAP
jgi:hypothetical protein